MRIRLLALVLLGLFVSKAHADEPSESTAQSYASFPQFFDSRAHLIHEIVAERLDCLEDRGLYDPKLATFDAWQQTQLIDCLDGIRVTYWHARDKELFPDGVLDLMNAASALDLDLNGFFQCVQTGQSCEIFAGGDNRYPDNQPVWSWHIATGLENALGIWRNDIVCAFTNDEGVSICSGSH